MVKSVCVYCGGAKGLNDAYLQVARDMGADLGKNKVRLVYGGGGSGLMGAMANSVLAHEGEVIGIIPLILKEVEDQHKGLTELLIVPDMHTRKRLMVDMSDAFVILPGGLGTLDEFFEIITWRKLKIHDKPVILVNTDGFWESLLVLLADLTERKFSAPPENWLTVVSSVAEVLPAIETLKASK